MSELALSLKQPWAALLAHGCKTIEVRRWATDRRGRVLIHAARHPDERPEVWALVPPELREAARLHGGIVGAGEVTGCIAYRSAERFAADCAHHLNDASWFESPVLYGFTFTALRPLPFRRCRGWMRFFNVEGPSREAQRSSQLLVSVRSAAEAEAALVGGAALIDVKDPERGSLGRAEDGAIAEVTASVAGRRPVSAALGELLDNFWKGPPAAAERLDYVKWGLAGFGHYAPLLWRAELRCAAERVAGWNPRCRLVVVAYADWRRAQAPSPEEVCAQAAEMSAGAFLLDTWQKDGTTLLDWLPASEIGRLCERGRAAGLRIALAGSLGRAELSLLGPLGPDWFAVRGAACTGGRRTATVDAGRVRELVALLSGSLSPTTHAN